MFIPIIGIVSSLAYGAANNQPMSCQQGLKEMQEKRYSEAIKSLNTCMETDLSPDAKVFTLETRARAKARLKHWDAAIADQQQAISLRTPKNAWTYLMLGVYLRENNQDDFSLVAMKNAPDFDEDGPGTGPEAAVCYQTAMTLHKTGQYNEVIEALTLGIPRQPDFGNALYQRALAYKASAIRSKPNGTYLEPQDLCQKMATNQPLQQN